MTQNILPAGSFLLLLVSAVVTIVFIAILKNSNRNFISDGSGLGTISVIGRVIDKNEKGSNSDRQSRQRRYTRDSEEDHKFRLTHGIGKPKYTLEMDYTNRKKKSHHNDKHYDKRTAGDDYHSYDEKKSKHHKHSKFKNDGSSKTSTQSTKAPNEIPDKYVKHTIKGNGMNKTNQTGGIHDNIKRKEKEQEIPQKFNNVSETTTENHHDISGKKGRQFKKENSTHSYHRHTDKPNTSNDVGNDDGKIIGHGKSNPSLLPHETKHAIKEPDKIKAQRDNQTRRESDGLNNEKRDITSVGTENIIRDNATETRTPGHQDACNEKTQVCNSIVNASSNTGNVKSEMPEKNETLKASENEDDDSWEDDLNGQSTTSNNMINNLGFTTESTDINSVESVVTPFQRSSANGNTKSFTTVIPMHPDLEFAASNISNGTDENLISEAVNKTEPIDHHVTSSMKSKSNNEIFEQDGQTDIITTTAVSLNLDKKIEMSTDSKKENLLTDSNRSNPNDDSQAEENLTAAVEPNSDNSMYISGDKTSTMDPLSFDFNMGAGRYLHGRSPENENNATNLNASLLNDGVRHNMSDLFLMPYNTTSNVTNSPEMNSNGESQSIVPNTDPGKTGITSTQTIPVMNTITSIVDDPKLRLNDANATYSKLSDEPFVGIRTTEPQTSEEIDTTTDYTILMSTDPDEELYTMKHTKEDGGIIPSFDNINQTTTPLTNSLSSKTTDEPINSTNINSAKNITENSTNTTTELPPSSIEKNDVNKGATTSTPTDINDPQNQDTFNIRGRGIPVPIIDEVKNATTESTNIMAITSTTKPSTTTIATVPKVITKYGNKGRKWGKFPVYENSALTLF